MDCNNVATRLWVGAQPPVDRTLPGFDTLALCAEEFQPSRMAFEGLVIRSPLPDGVLTAPEITRALLASRAVAEALQRGDRVLVTCHAGINRSALIASLALARITRMSARDLVVLMRTKRHPQALSNPHFVYILQSVVGEGRR